MKIDLTQPVYKPILICTALCLGAVSLGFYGGSYYREQELQQMFLSVKQIRAKNDKYPLVNRLIGTEMPNALSLGFYKDAESDIQDILRTNKELNISHFSLYFRDLNTGLWFGVNENEEYIPASLFKVPIAMTYFRAQSDNPTLFDKTLIYSQKEAREIGSVENLDTSTLSLGSSYSVRTLIEKMLIDSDNGAQRLLSNHIDTTLLNKIFSLVEVEGPEQDHYYISPKEYAFFLRMLYNASYLGLERSETLLEILERVSFSYGIRKGTPENIRVIHKFGSVNFTEGTGGKKTVGIHDCGVIYYPEKPYILCIMTQSSNQKGALEIIEKVSQYLYNYMSK